MCILNAKYWRKGGYGSGNHQWADVNPMPTAYSAFGPNCPSLKYQYIVPCALPQKQLEGSEPQNGLTRHRFVSQEKGRVAPINQLWSGCPVMSKV